MSTEIEQIEQIELDIYPEGDNRNRRVNTSNYKKRENEKEKKERDVKIHSRDEQRASSLPSDDATPAEPTKTSKTSISTRLSKEEKQKIYEQDMVINKPKEKEHKMKCFRGSHGI